MSISKQANVFVHVHHVMIFALSSEDCLRQNMLSVRTFYLPDTLAPISTAPATSNILAIIHACFKVSTFEPTDVPNELATSLAPIPNAKTKAKINPTTTTHMYSESWGSIMLRIVLDVDIVHLCKYELTRGDIFLREHK